MEKVLSSLSSSLALHVSPCPALTRLSLMVSVGHCLDTSACPRSHLRRVSHWSTLFPFCVGFFPGPLTGAAFLGSPLPFSPSGILPCLSLSSVFPDPLNEHCSLPHSASPLAHVPSPSLSPRSGLLTRSPASWAWLHNPSHLASLLHTEQRHCRTCAV